MTVAHDIPPELLARAAARCLAEAGRAWSRDRFTVEAVLTGRDYAAIPATPVQRALCRLADGAPVDGLLSPSSEMYHFGVELSGKTIERPRTIIVRAGVRSGKSYTAACGLIVSALTCSFRRPPEEGELPGLDGLVGVQPGEFVRAVIVAPKMELAVVTFQHVTSIMQNSRVLAPLLIRTAVESADIRRPDGNIVRVQMVAASTSGATLRSTWLAGAIADEADFHDGEDAAVNLGDNYRAMSNRMLRGAQIWMPSSPWSDEGQFHKMFVDAFGAPSDIAAFHSDTPTMNPTAFTPAEIAVMQRRDPETTAREVFGVPLKSGSKQFFPADVVKAAVVKGRELPLPVTLEHHYAGCDLGFRKNSSALAIARAAGRVVQLAYTEELRPEPDAPLVPGAVVKGFGALCQRYGATSMRGDLWYADTAKEALNDLDGPPVWYDEWLPTTDAQSDAFTTFRTLMAEGRVELPDDPRLLSMIAGVKSRPMPGGKVSIVLPKQGNAHADILMAVVLAVVQVTSGETMGEYDESFDAFLPTSLRD